MKTPNWKDQKITTKNGFNIVLSFEEEDLPAKDHFINDCGWSEEDYKEIKNYYWFTAKVAAFKGSIECGSTYLGANCYPNLKSVMAHNGDNSINCILGGYMPQLIDEAIEEAKENLGL